MIIFYGSRHYGKIDERGGEHAVTRFGHLYWVPLFPMGSIWVTQTHEDSVRGHDIRLSGKSVIAGYARVWGPIGVVAGVATGGVAGVAVAGAAGALAAWSWTWRQIRGERAERLSHLNLLAYGTRCDPTRMTDALLNVLHEHLEERWAEVANGRTPGDIARFGAEDPRQEVVAYGLLRVIARLGPRKRAAEAEAEAMRIADRIRDVTALEEGGPYRARLEAGELPR